MRKIVCLVLCLACTAAAAQEEEILKAAMYLSGASSEEETDESFLQMLEARKGRPVYINSNHLRPQGILTDYQVAVIQDYRASNGDILSWEELALLEGFSREAVEALQPFLSLYSSSLPGATDTVKTHARGYVRATLKGAGAKARAQGASWRAGVAARCADGYKKWDGTFFGEGTYRQHRVVAGHYRIRYGEGLALWTGFSMESLSTVDAFVKRAQGVSPVWSFTSSENQRGLAYEFSSVRWRASAFASLDKTFGGRAEYLGKRFQSGITAGASGGKLIVSADTKVNLKGTLLCAEIALRERYVAAKTTLTTHLGEYFRMAVQGRIVPQRYSGKKYGEYSLGAGGDFNNRKVLASVTADASFLPIPGTDPRRFQLRVYSRALWKINPLWSAEIRLTERYRNYELPRTALRSHAGYVNGGWNANARAEIVWCEKCGVLTYLEAGYKAKSFTLWLRGTLFQAEKWNDRIYVYERDAPGSFSVPAYYGKGANIALVGSYKYSFRYFELNAYLRAAYTFKNGHRPAPVLNFQLAWDF